MERHEVATGPSQPRSPANIDKIMDSAEHSSDVPAEGFINNEYIAQVFDPKFSLEERRIIKGMHSNITINDGIRS